jgi:hypothetical protein
VAEQRALRRATSQPPKTHGTGEIPLSDEVRRQITAEVNRQMNDKIRQLISKEVRQQITTEVNRQMNDKILQSISDEVCQHVSQEFRHQIEMLSRSLHARQAPSEVVMPPEAPAVVARRNRKTATKQEQSSEHRLATRKRQTPEPAGSPYCNPEIVAGVPSQGMSRTRPTSDHSRGAGPGVNLGAGSPPHGRAKPKKGDTVTLQRPKKLDLLTEADDPYQVALAHEINKCTTALTRKANHLDQIDRINERLARLRREWKDRSVRPRVETEQEYFKRTKRQPTYCPEIQRLLQNKADLRTCRKECLGDLRDLVGYRDHFPENERLIIEYCRIIKKLSRDIAANRDDSSQGGAAEGRAAEGSAPPFSVAQVSACLVLNGSVREMTEFLLIPPLSVTHPVLR